MVENPLTISYNWFFISNISVLLDLSALEVSLSLIIQDSPNFNLKDNFSPKLSTFLNISRCLLYYLTSLCTILTTNQLNTFKTNFFKKKRSHLRFWTYFKGSQLRSFKFHLSVTNFLVNNINMNIWNNVNK